MLDLFCLILGWLFAGDVAALGSPDYHTRAAATTKLAALWPLTEPAVAGTAWSPDPEVRMRGGIATGLADYRLNRVHPLLTHMIRGRLTAEERVAFWLITEPVEPGELPWQPTWADVKYGKDVSMRRAIVRMNHLLGLIPPDRALGLDPDWFVSDGQYLYGLSDLRFVYHGLPMPSDYFDQNRHLDYETKMDSLRCMSWTAWHERHNR